MASGAVVAETGERPIVTALLGEQNRAMTEAAVASLRQSLGLSDTEARRRFAAQPGLKALAGNLGGWLGTRQAGSWIDPADGRLVVNVLDAEGARTVEGAGARARIVPHNSAELERITTELAQENLPAGSSWGADPQADAVVVEVPNGRSFTPVRDYGDALITRKAAAPAQSLAGAARAIPTVIANTEKTDLYGGLTINRDRPGGGPCTSGFLIADSGFNYLLAAGHCGEVNSVWYRGNSKIGFISHREFGPNDFASIALTNYDVWQNRAWVFTRNGPQPVHGEAPVTVTGTTVCMRGAKTEYNCGIVTGFNFSYMDSGSGSTVRGVDRTSLCAVPGDSGAPVTVPQGNGVVGVGLLSGGATTSKGECQGVAWVEPLWKALDGAKLVTSN